MAIESSLFGYTSVEEVSPEFYEYTGCNLRRDIGPYPRGTEIPLIVLNYEEGEIGLCFQDDDIEDWVGYFTVWAGEHELKFTFDETVRQSNDDLIIYEGVKISRSVSQDPIKRIWLDLAMNCVEFETVKNTFYMLPLKLTVESKSM